MSHGSVLDRLADLEASLAALRSEARATDLAARGAEAVRPVRWARTVEPASGTYPLASSTPNTYPIVFLDGSYAQTVGTQTPTWTDRQSQARSVAHNVASGLDAYVPLGSIIPVWNDRGRWWTDWASPNLFHVTVGTTIPESSSGPITLPNGRVVTATNWGAAVVNGDKVLAWRTVTNGAWYFLKGGGSGGTLWFKGQLAQNVSSSSTTPISIKNLVSVTEGETAPGGTLSANNTMGWVGSNNDPCWLIKNTFTDPATWELMSVKWDEITRVKNVKYEAGALVQTKEAQIGKKIDPEIDSTILAALSATHVTNIGCNGLQNTWTYETIKYLGESLGSSSGSCTHTVPPPVTTSVQVVTGLFVSGTTMGAITSTVQCLGVIPNSGSFVWHVGTDCAEGLLGFGEGVAPQTATVKSDMSTYNAITAQNNFANYYS